MIKKTVAVLLVLCISFSVFSLDMTKAEPYSDDEFPKFVLDLRRAEVIFAGSLPLVYPVTHLAMSRLAGNSDFWSSFGISCAVSAGIAIADYFLGRAGK